MKNNTECGALPQLGLVDLEAVTGGRRLLGRVYGSKKKRGKGSGKSSN